MANPSWIMGLACEPSYSTEPPVATTYAVTTSNTVALFTNSPYALSSGAAIGCATGNTDLVMGTILCIRDSNGIPVTSLAASTAGTIEGTTDPDQIFRIVINSTAFADTDVGKFYNLTAETGTAQTATADGSPNSLRMLDGATESTSARQFIVLAKAPNFVNDAGAIYTCLLVRINPVNRQV